MNRISNLTLRYLYGAFLLTGSMQAMTAEEVAANGHVIVGTRRLPHADHVAVQEERAKEARQACEAAGQKTANNGEHSQNPVKVALESKESRKAASIAGLNKISGALYVTTHQGAFHNPLSVSFLGDAITLEDGSIWSVCSDDTYKTLNWLTSDLIVITPNHSWFSIYDYVITNQNTGIAVKVNLVLGPLVDAVYRYWIVAVDYLQDRVWLNDGSIWSMTDCTVMKKWQVGDTVIIGVNDGWYSSSNPNILINVNMLNYGRGICMF